MDDKWLMVADIDPLILTNRILTYGVIWGHILREIQEHHPSFPTEEFIKSVSPEFWPVFYKQIDPERSLEVWEHVW